MKEITGTTSVHTTQGPLIDQPLARNGRTFTVNHQGSTTTLTDGTGQVVQSYQYGPFGETTQSTGEVNPFQYAGRENDGATGLYYHRARYYRPEWGRFLSADPIGFDGGLNHYAYAGNNPPNTVDPEGLSPFNLLQQLLARSGSAVSSAGLAIMRASHSVLDRLRGVVGGTPAFASGQSASLADRLRQMTLEEIKKTFLYKEQHILIRQFFGDGPAGIKFRLENWLIPQGLKRETLEAYREIARRAIEDGLDRAGVQAGRLELIERALREMGP